MLVREATEDDVEGLATVHEETWHAAYAHVFPAEELQAFRSNRDRWRQNVRRDDATTLVADNDSGAVIGFATFGRTRDRGADCGEVYGIYVHPDSWDTGAGRALMEAAEAALVEAGFDRATLWVLDDNPRARRFYERAGWRVDGETKRDTHLGVAVNEVRYAKDLH